MYTSYTFTVFHSITFTYRHNAPLKVRHHKCSFQSVFLWFVSFHEELIACAHIAERFVILEHCIGTNSVQEFVSMLQFQLWPSTIYFFVFSKFNFSENPCPFMTFALHFFFNLKHTAERFGNRNWEQLNQLQCHDSKEIGLFEP